IVRVQKSHDGSFADNATGVCDYEKKKVKIKCKKNKDKARYESSDMAVEMDNRTGALKFIDRKTGKTILQENAQRPFEAEPVVQERIIYDDSSAHMEETANGKVTVKDIIRRDTIGTSTRYKAHFVTDGEKALYGLGSQMEDYMNLKGKTVYLTQHNLKIQIPVLWSTNGYGLLFDAGCAMKYYPDEQATDAGVNAYTMQLEAANELDYYVIMGDPEEVVKGYRELTGQVSLPPKYLFGYIQSKERYVSSDDILRTLGEYRRREVPIDMIVQDWNYWPEGWGYMKMNPEYYPDPKALADSVHAMNAKLMVSIWPNPQYCPEERDFRNRGYMLEHSVYDAFSPEARKHYWKYANDEFFSRGFDAWWCDSSEPLDGDWNQLPEPENGEEYTWDSHERRWRLNKDILSDAMGAERSSLYSLYHSKGIYENQRDSYKEEDKGTEREKRVVNLTRSSYAGQQKYGTVVWNGDTYASWDSFKKQIPSGLNYMATGNPYWAVDVGGFFTGGDGRWFRKGEFPKGVADDGYKEYYTRMFQWATFLPVLRSHGTDTPREIWQFGEAGTPYYDAILKMINLRYSLVPYIYSLAGKQSMSGYTMARPLAFDFSGDEEVLDLKDQYMFGDIMVCPVTDPKVESRRVYLPNGTSWHDYWSDDVTEGGRWIDAPTPLDRLPLYVKAGSIIVTAPPAQYTAAQNDQPLTISIYPGEDGHFEIYNDEGDNYNYERGAFCRVELKWDDKTHTLKIGERKGSYPGMNEEETFIVKTPSATKEIKYDGRPLSIKM
ncbi:MAG: DUF5110 domain-containing protein, partial [Muribaculaceae bacterium]|nr:DUF5110 domain-containing protein [Muribaculaceae bacterium]